MSFLEEVGKTIDTINVTISYRIIELFSAGLYSSPNKAFEELVCNSYDAFADSVSVYVPPDLTVDSAYIWVCDNGEGMGKQGLKDLWRIGSSGKRTPDRDKKRLQIGRFGIGKLATYILANKLTYVSKQNGRFLAVTMDYEDISDDSDLELKERELTALQAEELLTRYVLGSDKSLSFELFGQHAANSWTFSILTSLKVKAHEIKDGRLKWVLRTALPLSPGFKLYYNGIQVESSKIDRPLMKEWIIAKNDEIAEAHNGISCREAGGQQFLDFENLKGVHGNIELYEDSLAEGKSTGLGRSHGIFLMVRGRLINIDDPLLGLEALTHGVFNRTRIIIHADELDSNLTSTREAVKESQPLHQLKDYIKKKFNNEIRKYYFEKENKRNQEKSISHRLSKTSLTASKRPLLVFADKYFQGKIDNPLLINKPNFEKRENLLQELRAELNEDESFIKYIDWQLLPASDRIARLDLESRKLTMNLLHPFVANYIDEYKSKLPLQFVAITEVLTEAHLYELGLDELIVNSIIQRRDNTLRELSLSDREGSPAVAQMLKDAVADPTGLEDAVYRALLALGFEATPIGGKGKPDGVATAVLGFSAQDVNESYSLTYEAKSTGKKKIQARTAGLAVVNKHKKDYNAQYALVVAIDFEGASDEQSNISATCSQQKITAIRASDLIRLLLLSAPKQIGLKRLRGLLDTCYTPMQVRNWIDNIQQGTVEIEPIKDLLDTIYELQKTDTEPPEIASVRIALNSKLPNGKTLSKDKIKATIESLRTFIPGFISIEGEKIGIQGTPDKILSVVKSQISNNVPNDLQEMYLQAFTSL